MEVEHIENNVRKFRLFDVSLMINKGRFENVCLLEKIFFKR